MQGHKIINLVNGGQTIVSEEDYEYLSSFRWFRSSHGYAYRQWNEHRNGWVRHHALWMHRLINGTPPRLFTDHANGNKLDNRRSNLRTCNKAQNSANRPKNRINGTIYKGVSFHPSTGLWRARVKDGKWQKTTYHKTEEQAALDYNRMATEHFGEFAYHNQIPDGTEPTIHRKKSCIYRGVAFKKKQKLNPYEAGIESNGQWLFLGGFPTAEEAAVKYNEWAVKLHGDKARLNAPPCAQKATLCPTTTLAT